MHGPSVCDASTATMSGPGAGSSSNAAPEFVRAERVFAPRIKLTLLGSVRLPAELPPNWPSNWPLRSDARSYFASPMYAARMSHAAFKSRRSIISVTVWMYRVPTVMPMAFAPAAACCAAAPSCPPRASTVR